MEPVDFIPHGGGPCFFMDWTMGPADTWDRMAAWLRGFGAEPRPKAIVVVSGHWEERGFAVTGAARPPLIYDYFGFPPHTYKLQYAAPGAPEPLLHPVALDHLRGAPDASVLRFLS